MVPVHVSTSSSTDSFHSRSNHRHTVANDCTVIVTNHLLLCWTHDRILEQKNVAEKKNKDKMTIEEIQQLSRGWMFAFEQHTNLRVSIGKDSYRCNVRVVLLVVVILKLSFLSVSIPIRIILGVRPWNMPESVSIIKS